MPEYSLHELEAIRMRQIYAEAARQEQRAEIHFELREPFIKQTPKRPRHYDIRRHQGAGGGKVSGYEN